MQQLDTTVIEQALNWLEQGEPVWLCTVLATFGSSPREPGSMLAATASGRYVGSLSGGCVEEDFLERLGQGAFNKRCQTVRYGAGQELDGPQVSLPCGGTLDVLIERLEPDLASREHLEAVHQALVGHRRILRRVSLDGERRILPDEGAGARVEQAAPGAEIIVRIGPANRLIIAGASTVSHYCAEFAASLGYEVIVCDPRDEALEGFEPNGARIEPVLPSLFIAGPGRCHANTAVVALTHDPRIDDLAMMEAVNTPAFYIGVMGSRRTSQTRAERLQRTGGLTDDQLARIHMPIGLALGSKTPAEIALAVMADVLRVQKGKPRHEL